MEFVDNDKIKLILFEASKDIILPNFNNLKSNQINYKNNKDIVTNIDIEVENFLEKKLTNLINNSNFIGEEKFSIKPEILNYYNINNYCWTVDPIDGTFNFVKGKEEFAIMVALSFLDQILQSWIYKPMTEEFMYAKIDKGTYLNNKKIFIKDIKLLSESIGSISSNFIFSGKPPTL